MNPTIILPNSKEEKKLLIRCMVLTGTLLLLDQISKAVIEKYITHPIPVLTGFFNIVKVYNTGAAWGILAGKQWLLLAISIGFFLFVIFYFRKLAEGWTERYYSLALVVSGVFGNSVDRIWRDGKVVDFLDFDFLDISVPAFNFLFIKFQGFHMERWPAFNVADSAICIGVGIYMISYFKRPEAEKASNKEKEKKDN